MYSGMSHTVLLCVLVVIVSRLKTASGGSPLGTERSTATGGVRLVAASTIGEPRTGSWSYKTVRTTEVPKYFGRAQGRKECVTT